MCKAVSLDRDLMLVAETDSKWVTASLKPLVGNIRGNLGDRGRGNACGAS